MRYFYWIQEGQLAGSARPGSLADLKSDYDWLATQGIGSILNLHEDPLEPDPRFRFLYLPIPDFTAPDQQQLSNAMAFIDAQLQADRAVLVTCGAGLGRTGTILACWLVEQGLPAEEAIALVRDRRPGAIETPEQEATVIRWVET